MPGSLYFQIMQYECMADISQPCEISANSFAPECRFCPDWGSSSGAAAENRQDGSFRAAKTCQGGRSSAAERPASSGNAAFSAVFLPAFCPLCVCCRAISGLFPLIGRCGFAAVTAFRLEFWAITDKNLLFLDLVQNFQTVLVKTEMWHRGCIKSSALADALTD